MNDLPDLVRDSKLQTAFRGDQTIHYIEDDESDNDNTTLLVKRWEHWEHVESIGSGAHGNVVLQKCVQGATRRDTRAVKVVSKAQCKRLDYIRELEAIAKFSGKLYSRHFVKFLGWYETNDSVYICMEYFPLGDLQDYISEFAPIPESDTGSIISQVLQGIHNMHEQGFAHRDIKPGNVLIRHRPPEHKRWDVKISDFGISKRTGHAVEILSTIKGTRPYMAPEVQTQEPGSQNSIDFHAADMWSLGEMTGRMLTKSAMFPSHAALFRYMAQPDKFVFANMQNIKISSQCEDFIRGLLKPDPTERPTARTAVMHPWIRQFVPQDEHSIDRPETNLPEQWVPKPSAPAKDIFATIDSTGTIRLSMPAANFDIRHHWDDVPDAPTDTPLTAEPNVVTRGPAPINSAEENPSPPEFCSNAGPSLDTISTVPIARSDDLCPSPPSSEISSSAGESSIRPDSSASHIPNLAISGDEQDNSGSDDLVADDSSTHSHRRFRPWRSRFGIPSSDSEMEELEEEFNRLRGKSERPPRQAGCRQGNIHWFRRPAGAHSPFQFGSCVSIGTIAERASFDMAWDEINIHIAVWDDKGLRMCNVTNAVDLNLDHYAYLHNGIDVRCIAFANKTPLIACGLSRGVGLFNYEWRPVMSEGLYLLQNPDATFGPAVSIAVSASMDIVVAHTQALAVYRFSPTPTGGGIAHVRTLWNNPYGYTVRLSGDALSIAGWSSAKSTIELRAVDDMTNPNPVVKFKTSIDVDETPSLSLDFSHHTLAVAHDSRVLLIEELNIHVPRTVYLGDHGPIIPKDEPSDSFLYPPVPTPTSPSCVCVDSCARILAVGLRFPPRIAIHDLDSSSTLLCHLHCRDYYGTDLSGLYVSIRFSPRCNYVVGEYIGDYGARELHVWEVFWSGRSREMASSSAGATHGNPVWH